MKGLRLGLALLLAGLLDACAKPEPPSGIEDRDWYLVAIQERTLSLPAEKSRPTLRLEASRVAGFAGCNHFAGGYTLGPDRALKLGPLASTKMFCADTAAIEDAYLAALERVVRWSVEGDQLTLESDAAPVLRFREMTETRRVH